MSLKGASLGNRAIQKIRRVFARFGVRGRMLDVVEQTLHDVLDKEPPSPDTWPDGLPLQFPIPSPWGPSVFFIPQTRITLAKRPKTLI
ncbi:uncharacterized protein CDV56_102646 [Aspergillus thermomutatus]|uniref:Uncharacterized protein n=1 Tax=Aspergillus thermomutatus TaxID=41047 RepID=A0A397GC77_ASPTH|nr:uncharacterized protein CDV56_102646 [Aspergillus thermomutatus]RHZ46563.1 hypothetical protein CDV56_102646 [Aspergillus thermomutatus]